MSSTLVHCFPEVDDDAPPSERLAELARGIGILLRDERVEHLDDRHFGAEALEDRRELTADDPASEDDQPPRYVGLREEAVESTQRGESRPGMGGRMGYEPVAMIALEKLSPTSPVSNAIERASSNRPAPWNQVTPLALKSEATPPVICFTTAAFHSLACAKSSGLSRDDAEPGRSRVRRGVRALFDPGLGRNTSDAQARSPELGLLVDARDTGTELRGPDRRRIAGRPTPRTATSNSMAAILEA